MSARMKSEALRLSAEGMSGAEIARLLTVPDATVYGWLDPDTLRKQRERRKRYQGTCVDCGVATDGSNGRAAAPMRCAPCQAVAGRIWTEEAVVTAIKLFAQRYGRRPSTTDFNTAQAIQLGHPERAERFYRDGDYPVVAVVIARFGTWNAAMQAAGFPPRRAGQYDRSQALT